MPRLGVVLGGGARELEIADSGQVTMQRHGERYRLPHEIDHVANMQVLRETGCDRVLAIGSVGGLRAELDPGKFVVPDDFIALDAPPASALEGIGAHRVPRFDPQWRDHVLRALADAKVDVVAGGVYWQATGPRLETPAEIRFVAPHADVIGMTIASECVAAGELGLRYAAICVVDNFANGVVETELTVAEVEAGRARNREALAETLSQVAPRLA